MKLGLISSALVLVIASAIACLTGCPGPQNPGTVTQEALTDAQLICVLAQAVTDTASIQAACQITNDLAPAIEKAIADAKDAGVGRLPPAGK